VHDVVEGDVEAGADDVAGEAGVEVLELVVGLVYGDVVCVALGEEEDVLDVDAHAEVEVFAGGFAVDVLEADVHGGKDVVDIVGGVDGGLHRATACAGYCDALVHKVGEADAAVEEEFVGTIEPNDEVLIGHDVEVIKVECGDIVVELHEGQPCAAEGDIEYGEELCVLRLVGDADFEAKGELAVVEHGVAAVDQEWVAHIDAGGELDLRIAHSSGEQQRNNAE